MSLIPTETYISLAHCLMSIFAECGAGDAVVSELKEIIDSEADAWRADEGETGSGLRE
jgi:hypothetical protein